MDESHSAKSRSAVNGEAIERTADGDSHPIRDRLDAGRVRIVRPGVPLMPPSHDARRPCGAHHASTIQRQESHRDAHVLDHDVTVDPGLLALAA
ncbi:hypothetical protein NX869_29735, partial [Burkholderia thailandensis]|uniref:hypothetical protein n=1 Tax=Burkholderia thailandensis TaxID=57975 RepID=UPI00217CF6E4